MSGPDIFISYCREDRPAARRFADALTRQGFNVWWDAVIHSGETFDEVIETNLRAARAVIVLWSPRSVGSRWVRAEATLADRAKKLLPAIIEPCDRPVVFELTHTVDLSHWDGDVSDPSWKIFVEDLTRHLQHSGTVAAQPEAPKRPAQYHVVDELPPQATPFEDEDAAFEATQFYTRTDAPREDEELHVLELSDGEEILERHIVGPLGVRIGRSAPADIVLADPRVSRAHCMIEMHDDGLKVSDLNSTNGTFIDDERVEDAQALPVGSVLRVGKCTLTHEVCQRRDLKAG